MEGHPSRSPSASLWLPMGLRLYLSGLLVGLAALTLVSAPMGVIAMSLCFLAGSLAAPAWKPGRGS